MIVRSVLVLLTLAVLSAGPVAACLCADAGMPPMPCCPDESETFSDPCAANVGDAAHVEAACTPSPADLLPAGSSDVPPFVGIALGAPPPWQTHGPPVVPAPQRSEPHDHRPVYLVTLRFKE